MNHRKTLLLAATFLLAACGGPAPGADRPLDLRLTREWSIGGSQDHRLSLTQLFPFQIGASAAGDLFVLGYKERRIYVITSEGQVTDSIGRQGEGPGEFVDPLSLSVGQDGSLAVVDFGLRRITRWSAEKGVLDPIQLTSH